MARRKQDIIKMLAEHAKNYTYEDNLDSGSTGQVCILNREGVDFVLKLPRDDLDTLILGEVNAMMRQEWRVLSNPKLRDTAIVQVYDLWELTTSRGKVLGLLMEYLAGGTFQKTMAERQHPYDPLEAIDLLLPLLEPLSIIHEEGMTHCDVAPDNVLFTLSGKAKLADLGIARKMHQTSGHAKGKPSFVAPELNPENPLNAPDALHPFRASYASDLYAFACVLFSAMTLRPLLPGSFSAAYQRATDRSYIPDSIGHMVGEPRDTKYDPLRSLFLKILEPDLPKREEHFPNARQFAEALRDARNALVPPAVDIGTVAAQLSAISDGTEVFSHPPSRIDASMLLTRLQNQHGEDQRQLAILVANTLQNPSVATNRYLLGKYLLDKHAGDHSLLTAALAQLDAALGADSNCAPAHSERATILRFLAEEVQGPQRTQRLQAAIVSAKKSVACEPKNPFFHENLGKCYRAAGFFEEAKHCYDEVRRIRPSHPTLDMRMASYYQHTGDPERARSHYVRAIAAVQESREGNLGYVHIRFASFLITQGDFPNGLEQLMFAIESNPSYASRAFRILSEIPAVHRLTQDY
ncbi:MAG TPA: protein kinase, partial [Candidatus Nanoarchaeia archaeon]|nr:protein kinase [Candidatus Nanoarchaeia archaeon]